MSKIKRLVPVFIILLAFVLIWASGLSDYLGLDAIRRHREMLQAIVTDHALITAVVFVAVYAFAVAVSVPGASFLTLLGGFLFGTWIGGALVVMAATVGAVAIFLIAKSAFGESLADKIGPRMKRIKEGFRENGASYLLVLRLVPLFPFWLVNLVPAFLGVSLKVFTLSTLFGIMPASFVYASLGSGLGAILDDGGEPDMGLILQPEVIGPLVALAALSMMPVLYKFWQRRHHQLA